jgi:aminoglycoside phosphotransferase (APT) family kinase protein
MTSPAGVEAAGPWLAGNVPGAAPPFRFEPVPGGSSNPTFFVSGAGGACWVLRRPPVSGVLPSAHDMAREFRVLTAVHSAGFPVPVPVRYCSDTDVLGAPFYVMEHLEGLVLRTAADAEQLLDAASRRRAAQELVDALARLHALEPDAIGLGDLGQRHGYLARQMRRWRGQVEASAASSGVPQPALEALYERLSAALPEGGPTGIVHGDFRLGNAIVAEDGRLLAVLDWELCTLGDTLADAAHMLLSWLEYPAPLPEGLPSGGELASAYLERTGDLDADLGYYMAFAAWRLGCILAGVHARYAAGVGAGDLVDPASHLARIERLAALAESALAGELLEGGVKSLP